MSKSKRTQRSSSFSQYVQLTSSSMFNGRKMQTNSDQMCTALKSSPKFSAINLAEYTATSFPPYTPDTFKQMINDETNTIFQSSAINALDKCTQAQQEYINQYRSNLIKDGYKPEFAARTCAFMVVLYQAGIENELNKRFPKPIDATKTVRSKSDADARKQITTHLKTTMEQYGGNYKIIANWLTHHQGSSWSDDDKAMKHFLISNLKPEVPVDNRFYLGTYNKLELQAAYNAAVQSPENQKCYETSMLMYKAFTAIVLSTVKNDFIDQSTQMVTVKRGDKAESMQSAYPGYDLSVDISKTKTLPAIRGGIADSTSLGAANSKFCGDGYVVRTFHMPFSRIHAAYFISPELCCDLSPYLKPTYAAEREIICDMSNLGSQIL